MRRTIILLVALALFCLGATLPVTAAPSPEGALRSSFQSGFSGGIGTFYATVVHGGAGFLHAANATVLADGVDVGARRISPLWPEQEYCSDYVFGIFVVHYSWGEPRSLLAEFTWDMWLNGEPLPMTYSAVKRLPDPQGVFFEGEQAWTRSIGVPVYGTLDPGIYHLHGERRFRGDVQTRDSQVTIVDCSD